MADVQLIENIKGTSRKLLDETLRPDEVLHVVMEGVAGQCLVATDRRIIITKTGGGAGGFLVGKKVKVFPYEHVSSVDCSKGLVNGRVQVSAAGTDEVKGGYFTGAFAAENVVNFYAASFRKFQAATNAIRDLMDAARLAASHSVAPALSLADEIQKLAALKEAGILTDDEFQTKKTELLARM